MISIFLHKLMFLNAPTYTSQDLAQNLLSGQLWAPLLYYHKRCGIWIIFEIVRPPQTGVLKFEVPNIEIRIYFEFG